MLRREFAIRANESKNPLNTNKLCGFSQSDEDSITLEILKRIGLREGYFVEFGVGNGLENNTLVLLALGWRGNWFGGEKIVLDTTQSSKLKYEKIWITKENICQLYNSIDSKPNVISLDLDGNDIYLAEELLSNGVRPELFIVEYNAKFPPPISFQIDYNASHKWTSDDYFGASLSSFDLLFKKFDYRLICCSTSGANAFFVHSSCSANFSDIPTDICEIYSDSFYFLRTKKMHPTSVKTLQKLIRCITTGIYLG